MAAYTAQRRRPRKIRLGIPALIVGILAVVALWRVGAPGESTATHGTAAPVLAPIERLVDVLTDNSIGREASIENVPVRSIVSERLFIAGDADHRPVYVAIDPRVTTAVQPGQRVTLVGKVEPAPEPAIVQRDWHVDEPTAREITEGGVYLLAREIRSPQ